MKNILIAGGSGLIGTYLGKFLKEEGHEVSILSRSPSHDSNIKSFQWDPSKRYIQKEAVPNVDLVINLAGTSVAGGRWTQSFKEKMLKSRVDSTETLVEVFQNTGAHLINASAIGYYPNSKKWVNEDDPSGDVFLSHVCSKWERSAQEYEGPLSIVRIGIVLSAEGGFLEATSKPIRYGVGAALGDGSQMISWIHVEDLARIILFLADKNHTGIFNATAPNPVSNKAMTKAIAKELNRPLLLPPVPKFALKILFGEFSSELLSDHKVSSEKLSTLGYEFQFQEVNYALHSLLAK